MLKQREMLARRAVSNLRGAPWAYVRDPRSRRGTRHRLDGILMVLVVGLALACRTLRDLEALTQDLPARGRLRLRGSVSDTTFDRIVRAVSPEDLGEVLVWQVRDMIRSKQLPNDPALGISLVAIDGKRFGTSDERTHPEARRGGNGKAPYFQVLALRAVHVSSAVKPALGQRVVAANAGEQNTFWPFLTKLLEDYGGFVECVSVDAGFTTQLNLMRMNEERIGYIAALKGNQEVLEALAHAELGDGEADPPQGWSAVHEESVGSKRTLREFARVKAELAGVGRPNLATQIWRVRKQVFQGGSRTLVEDRYFLTNLAWDRLTPKQGLAAVRAHWGIENDCNWTLDARLGEDLWTWVNQGQASEVLALLRLVAYNLLRLLRHRALRSEENRAMSWRILQARLRLALMTPPWAWTPTSTAWEPSGIA